MSSWHIVTCEYPPQVGGVGDFVAAIATGLAAHGDSVHVWCPQVHEPHRAEPGGMTAPLRSAEPDRPAQLDRSAGRDPISGSDRIVVHRELGTFGPRDLRRAGRLLDRFPAPRHLLVQWVPHGYGYRSMNLPFAVWLALRGTRHGTDRLAIVLHEPFLAWTAHPWRLLQAAAHRVMLLLAASGAHRMWISIRDWETPIRPFVPRALSIDWMPIPSPLPVVSDPIAVARIRRQLAPRGERVIGHFGTHSSLVTRLLDPVLERVLASPDVRVVSLGRGSEAFVRAFGATHPSVADRVSATGVLSPGDVSRHLQACDLLLQPYPDGISARRTTATAALAHGRPVVTNAGAHTEAFWRESAAVELLTTPDPHRMAARTLALLDDAPARAGFEARGRQLYDRMFDVRHAVAALTQPRPEAFASEHAFADR